MNADNKFIKQYIHSLAPIKAREYIDNMCLPEKYSKILKLHIVERKSVSEINYIMGMSDSTIKKIIRDSLTMIVLTNT